MMKAKTDMSCVGKTFRVFILLIIAVATATMDIHGRAGLSISLNCFNTSSENLVSVIWKIRLRTGNHCTLAYRTDWNRRYKNCSERIDLKFNPNKTYALQIPEVNLTHEGSYTCETANIDGTFYQNYTLTVLVAPEVTLTCGNNGSAICKAAAGKPAAQVSWDPSGDPRAETENHTNGTVTVLSTYSPKEISATCLVSHPTGNTSQSCLSGSGIKILVYASISAGLLGIVFILAFIFLYKLHPGRICCKSKRPETTPTHSMQESNEPHELEPYASYVQKENTIYNTAYEVKESEDLPPGLQSAT
ncbi:cell surface glycoprotein CD200 receptor 1 [Carettochelys insculpta]|uniref:cell surface glycoprotein CD200 receptor 1 n=1 Tax=Carettochelys insculpta TaxID=44489 RepID=UPI003EBB5F8E